MQILNTVQSVYRLVAILCLIEYNITSTNQAKGYMFLHAVSALFDISMQKEGNYTYKTYVYSLGLVLYEMHHPVCSATEKHEVSV